jgi:c-di-GMP-binding flagellar brake protein YcgR
MDLSMGGGTLETDAKLTSGALLQVSFQPSEWDPHITVAAAVVRSVRASSAGLEFLRIQSADQESLRQFMFRILSERRA